jgi:hypothetical protein
MSELSEHEHGLFINICSLMFNGSVERRSLIFCVSVFLCVSVCECAGSYKKIVFVVVEVIFFLLLYNLLYVIFPTREVMVMRL